ncbi:MAG: hypothetical protein NTX22_02150 [Ignavibacteriales bacterium]|nr:hypothetical protein [Ignavibacteriales bacterium]
MLIWTSIYLLLPFFFVNSIESADNHYVKTLRNYDNRVGKYIELDRAYIQDSDKQSEIITFANERIEIFNKDFRQSGIISVQGRFITSNMIQIKNYHMHSEIRDITSYLGLFLVSLLIIITLRKEQNTQSRREWRNNV